MPADLVHVFYSHPHLQVPLYIQTENNKAEELGKKAHLLDSALWHLSVTVSDDEEALERTREKKINLA